MSDPNNYLRQVIVARKDLSMPAGKLAAMVAHAAMTFIYKRIGGTITDLLVADCFTADQWQWLTELEPGLEYCDQLSFAKIVLAVPDLEALSVVEVGASAAGLECHRVVDGGHSHNKPGDIAAIAIGPDWPAKLQPVTGHLKLYR